MAKDIVILAAGVGSRLRPLTDTVPKTMVWVNGQTIIQRLFTQLEQQSLDLNIYVVGGYKCDQLAEHLNETDVPYQLIENSDFDKTNNMYSLWMALKAVSSENDLVIINADCVYDDEIVTEMIHAPSTVVAIDKSVYSEESMKVKTDQSRQIIGMSKQLPEEKGVFVSIDIYHLLRSDKEKLREIVNQIISGGNLNSWTEVALDKLCQLGTTEIMYLDMTGKRWMEIDNLEDLKKAISIFGQ